MKIITAILVSLIGILMGPSRPLYAEDLPHTWGPYYSSDKKFQIVLVPFSASVSYVGQLDTAIEVTLEDFHPDSDTDFNEPPKVEWSRNGHFFSISGQAGPHGQYSFTNLFRMAEISAGSARTFSVEKVTLLFGLGRLLEVDPALRTDERWTLAGIKFSKEGIDVTYAAAGRNSHQFDGDSDTTYVIHLKESEGRSFVLSSIERNTTDGSTTVFRN